MTATPHMNDRLEDGMENVALMDLVDEVRDLPLTVSEVLSQVITECDNPDASVASLARIMAGDQALAAMVLKLANSAYYGYARKIESLPDAVVLLGFASVKNLAITASITRLLAASNDELSKQREDIFNHSLCVAIGSRLLGRQKRISGEKAFVGGLLHDLGLIVLVCYRKPQFVALYQAAVEAGKSYAEVEEGILGYAHAELGALVAAEWKFPPALCEAIRYHHDPEAAATETQLARAVHIADWVAKKLGVGYTPESLPETPDPAACAQYGLDEAGLARLVEDVRSEFFDNDSLRGLGRVA